MTENQISFPIKISNVHLIRRLFDIPDWDKVLTMLLSIDWNTLPYDSYTDLELARRIVPTVRHHRKLRKVLSKIKIFNWNEQPLGKMSDGALAKKLGVTRKEVFLQREKRNIPIFVFLNWDALPLGQMPDTELAKKLGETIGTIFKERKIRNIPKFKKLPKASNES